jgi:hypothetical protein
MGWISSQRPASQVNVTIQAVDEQEFLHGNRFNRLFLDVAFRSYAGTRQRPQKEHIENIRGCKRRDADVSRYWVAFTNSPESILAKTP